MSWRPSLASARAPAVAPAGIVAAAGPPAWRLRGTEALGLRGRGAGGAGPVTSAALAGATSDALQARSGGAALAGATGPGDRVQGEAIGAAGPAAAGPAAGAAGPTAAGGPAGVPVGPKTPGPPPPEGVPATEEWVGGALIGGGVVPRGWLGGVPRPSGGGLCLGGVVALEGGAGLASPGPPALGGALALACGAVARGPCSGVGEPEPANAAMPALTHPVAGAAAAGAARATL